MLIPQTEQRKLTERNASEAIKNKNVANTLPWYKDEKHSGWGCSSYKPCKSFSEHLGGAEGTEEKTWGGGREISCNELL